MRILHVIPQYAPLIGGAERQAQGLAEAQRARGHEVAVLTQKVVGQAAEETIGGVRVHRWLGGVPLGPIWGLSYMMSVMRGLRRLREGTDVVHCHQVYLHSALAARLRRSGGPPVVCKILLSGPQGDLERLASFRGGARLLRWARELDGVLAISGEVERECLSFDFPAARIHRIPNFVDTRAFRPDPDSAPGQNWLFVGRLQPQKGLDLLLQAMAKARGAAEELRLTVLGTGPDEGSLKALAGESELGNRVTFAGAASDPLPYYRAARGVILPSRSEGLSNVMLEALACGKPLIATEVGGAAEVMDGTDSPMKLVEGASFRRARHGLLVRPGSAEALAEALEAAENGFDDLAAHGLAAAPMIQNRFSRDAVLDKLETLYRHLKFPDAKAEQ